MCCEVIRLGYFQTVSASAVKNDKPRQEETRRTQESLSRVKTIPIEATKHQMQAG